MNKDSKNMRTIKDYRDRIGNMRNHYILMAARCFDIHKDYDNYSVGIKEFEVQRVSVL